MLLIVEGQYFGFIIIRRIWKANNVVYPFKRTILIPFGSIIVNYLLDMI